MKRSCDSVEHAMNLWTLHEMEEMLPMDSYERNSLRRWVYKGNDPEKNPWNYTDDDGWMLNYLEAYRYHHGYKLICKHIIIEE